MSFPFHGKEFVFVQPDGTELKVRGWGDQYNARFETLDGHPVVLNSETGFYEYAEIDKTGEEVAPMGVRAGGAVPKRLRSGARKPTRSAKNRTRSQIISDLPRGTTRWEERRQQKRTTLRRAMITSEVAAAPPPQGTIGTYVGLCLLVQFPDVHGTITQQEVEEFCNKPGYNGFGNNGSVYDYFFENSLGKMKYTNVVAPYYTAKNKRSYYTDEKVTQPRRTLELIKEALDDLTAKGFDFSALSTDDQGYVYALNVFYAGPCVNRWAKGLWPHSSSLDSPYTLTQDAKAYDYQITNMGDQLTLGTFCHENGHMVCDFPDLYDYDSDSEGIGVYCLMCAGGAVQGADTNPTQICAYLKNAAGWGTTRTIASGQTFKARAGKNEFFIHKKDNNEYFIIENRFQEGRDSLLTDSGLAVWHVDHLGSNDNQQGTPARHYECALMQADGKKNLEKSQNVGDSKDLFRQGNGTKFGAKTKPNSKWWNKKASGLEISAIGAAGKEITFTAK
ncbi:MAG: M6 family metalloprotease domain-containing protein [Candidatus Hydrogenedentes bacterium]|nr:M6 family metalloprotease domain-containing protein [Candidatus Hydrogenedentota bacterium]